MKAIQDLVEIGIYADDLGAAERYYTEVLGLSVRGKEAGRHVFFQVGEAGVLLAFLAEATLRGDHLPPHGATGPGHFALGIDSASFDAWREQLQGHGVAIEQEIKAALAEIFKIAELRLGDLISP